MDNNNNKKSGGLMQLVAYGCPNFFAHHPNSWNKPYYEYNYNKYKNDMNNEKYVHSFGYCEFIDAKYNLGKISSSEYYGIIQSIHYEKERKENEIRRIYQIKNTFLKRLYNRLFNINNNKSDTYPDVYEYSLNNTYYNYIYNKYKNEMNNEQYINRDNYKLFFRAKWYLKKLSDSEYFEIKKNIECCENEEIYKIERKCEIENNYII